MSACQNAVPAIMTRFQAILQRGEASELFRLVLDKGRMGDTFQNVRNVSLFQTG